jgi:kumamolisin
MSKYFSSTSVLACLLTISASALLVVGTAARGGLSVLARHVPSAQIATAVHLGRLDGDTPLSLVVSMNLKDQNGLDEMARRIYDPQDKLYHHFMTTDQITEAFSPSDADVAQVTQYLSTHGLTVSRVHANRLFVDVQAKASDVENAFQLELHQYLTKDGRIVFAPTSDPSVADEIAPRLAGIVGLDTFSRRIPHIRRIPQSSAKGGAPGLVPPGNGISAGGMDPSDIHTAYNIPTTMASPGSGQTVALVEYASYTPSDITQYATSYSLPSPSVTPVTVDTGPSNGYSADNDEVTLDIEMILALAPYASIQVYEAPATDSGELDMLSDIYTAGELMVSESWGTPEIDVGSSLAESEGTVLEEMAVKGQTLFASTGDYGAYGATESDGYSGLAVQDPSTQYYAVAVGGTTLSVNDSTMAYTSETSWSNTAASPNEGGGGGISTLTSIPSWQVGLATTANHGSTSMRMVPDVSLDADPDSGYSVYYDGAWYVFGGTSAATPLWAAFSTLVNQARVAASESSLGFLAPTIYQTAASTVYGSTFHDIADGSTNLYYPAETGYDLSTGWGTFRGTGLFDVLTAAVLPSAAPTLTITSASTTSVSASWTTVSGATSYDLWESTSETGTYSDVCAASSTTSCTVSSLANGVDYYFYVTATNSVATSGPSVIVEGSPVLEAPSTPTGLTATVVQ